MSNLKPLIISFKATEIIQKIHLHLLLKHWNHKLGEN